MPRFRTESVFNRGLNAVLKRSALRRGQSVKCENMDLLETSVRRRKGKREAYSNVLNGSFAVGVLKRFYRLASSGVTKRFLIGVDSTLFHTGGTDWSDDTASGGASFTTIEPPAESRGSLYSEYDSVANITMTDLREPFQSRDWCYFPVENSSADDALKTTGVPIRTEAGINSDYQSGTGDHNMFLHGLTPPASLDRRDTETSALIPKDAWDDTMVAGAASVNSGGGPNQSVVDSEGNIHVLWRESGDVYYSKYTGTWSAKEAVSGAITAGGSFQLAICVDKADNPHVAYHDGTNIIYATKAFTGSWDTETAVTGGTIGAYLTIVYPGYNQPTILYYDGTNSRLGEAVRENDATWTTATVDTSAADVGTYVSAVTDSSGVIHAAYVDVTNGNLRYATKSVEESWTLADANTANTWTGATSIAVDAQNAPHIVAFSTTTSADFDYVERTAGSWSTAVDARAIGSSAATPVCLAIDGGGVAHVAFSDTGGVTQLCWYGNNATGSFDSLGAHTMTNNATDTQVCGMVIGANSNLIVAVNPTGTGGGWGAAGTGVGLIESEAFVTYYYRLTAEYDDGRLGESGPGAAFQVRLPGDIGPGAAQILDLNSPASGSNRYDMTRDVTRIHVYRTVKGASENGTYYRIATVECTNGVPDNDVIDTTTDADLISKIILDQDRFMPPKWQTGTFWKDRAVIGNLKVRETDAVEGDANSLDLEEGGYHPNRIRFSRAFQPDIYPSLTFIDVDVGGESGDIKKLIVNRKMDALMVFLEDDTILVDGDTPLGERGAPFRPMNIPRAGGTPAGESVVDVDGLIMAWTKTGIQAFDGVSVLDITSKTIAPLWNMLDSSHELYDDRINMNQINLVRAVFAPREKMVMWSYPSATSTVNDKVLVLHLDRWREGRQRDGAFSIYSGWNISCWAKWQGEGDRQEIFGGEAVAANFPWTYRVLFGDQDVRGNGNVTTASAQITGELKTGGFDFRTPDRIRYFRNLVMNAQADAGDGSDDTSLAVFLDINDGALTQALGTWDPTGGNIKHMTSNIPKAAMGTYAALDIVSTDTDSPDPWELFNVSLEFEDLPSRSQV